MKKDKKALNAEILESIKKQIDKSQIGVAVGSAPIHTYELAPMKKPPEKK